MAQTPIWIGSAVDIKEGKQALDALNRRNDTQFIADGAITKVTHERWKEAQKYERDTWMVYANTASTDRNNEHYQNFEGYACLPSNLGKLIEIGCGPFTQTKTIIADHTVESITLVDPLIGEYLNHQHCSYSRFDHPTLLPIQAEDIPIDMCDYDTVVCINVLEHVRDAPTVLANLIRLVKLGGNLVFCERAYDGTDLSMLYDVGHPIRINAALLDQFFAKFNKKLYNVIPMHDTFCVSSVHYFIGTKTE